MKKSLYFTTIIICLLNNYLASAQSCEGPSILSADFNDNAIPAGWTVISLDGNALYWNMEVKGYTGEWQPYNHYGRQCVTSASRYDDYNASSDDYLITPAITLGTAPICLSWKSSRAYNTTQFSEEHYQVLISTTTPDPEGLNDNPVLLSVTEEQETWVDHSVDLSAYAGQTIYIGFWQYTSGGYALCLDDIKVSNPVSLDASVVSLDGGDLYLPNTNILISGEITNGGTSTLNSFNINWNVDGGSAQTEYISGLNIASQESYQFIHSASWTPSSNGTYYLKVWTDGVNIYGDDFALNDTITKVIYVNDFPRKVLMEEFTNASCPPCADQNPAYDDLIFQNIAANKVTAIKYHVGWPGIDPMNDENPDQAEDRVAYYGVYGVPFATTDGGIEPACSTYWTGAPICVEQNDIDSLVSIPSIFEINTGTSSDGSNYIMNTKITAKTDIPANSFTAHVVLLEDSIDYGSAPGTNGEIVFYQVMRRMFPTSDGVLLDALSNGQSTILNYSTPIESYYNESNLRVLVFIQKEDGKKIYQSDVTDASLATAVQNVASPDLEIYPNPVSNFITISSKQNSDGIISIVNSLGVEIFSVRYRELTVPNHINVSDFSPGVYFLQLKTKDNLFIRKLVKQ